MRDGKDQQKDESKSFISIIGLVGGILGASSAYVSYFFNFIPYGPAVIWQFWPSRFQGLNGAWGHLTAIVMIGLVSIFTAWLYYALFGRIETAWMGIWYGLALWVVLFLGIHPLIPGLKSVKELGWQTNIVLLCIFLLYGLFVGYSISYEVQQRNAREEAV